ncbi:MAG: hypothetical protein K5768_01970 [Firmicutes bacterium]|nr:hypothetical protein [Bacillota bacterium]
MALFAVKNDSSIPCISVFLDGKRIFADIIKGEMSKYAFLPCGSAALTVYNNFEKPVFDKWISIPPHKRLVLSVNDSFLKFI